MFVQVSGLATFTSCSLIDNVALQSVSYFPILTFPIGLSLLESFLVRRVFQYLLNFFSIVCVILQGGGAVSIHSWSSAAATLVDCLVTGNKRGSNLNLGAFHIFANLNSLTIINSDPSSQTDAISGSGASQLVACSTANSFSPCEASAINCAAATPQLGVVCTYNCSTIANGATCTDTECPTGICKSFTCDANKVSYCFGIFFIHCSHEYNFITDCFV